MAFHLFHILIKIYLSYKVKVGLKKIFTSQFQTYLLPTFIILFFFQISYSIYYKPNVGMDVFKMKNKNFPIYFFVFL